MATKNQSGYSSNETAPEQSTLLFDIVDSFYVFLGSFSMVTNGIIIAVVLVSAKLRNRKELLLLVALAIADLMFSFCYATRGARRLSEKDIYHDRVPRKECLKHFELTVFS